ncbi:hypothetical protein [Chryseobacterium sp. 6424]|uniref:hypothetical protein n=1 Tax=Chryseobacterium sp. 6424 TaxID=2039166 RepID=UPI0013CEF307|nr:hypothetical protein [Chryseobacterium sp. 6424]
MTVTNREAESYPPLTDEEKKHQERLTNLLNKKRRGDWVLVGELLGCEAQAAEKSFKRIHSKNHLAAVEALEKIISNRINLLKP